MKRSFIFLLHLAISHQILYGQGMESLALDNKQSILNNKAWMHFPTDAKTIARDLGIMAADPNTNLETRIVFDVRDKRLVFFAQELFLLGSENLLKDLSKKYAETQMLVSHFSTKDSLETFLLTPLNSDSTNEAIFINGMVVKNTDNTLFQISAYINPQAYSNREEFIHLAEKVFRTITPGTRKVDRSKRIEQWPIIWTKRKFQFSLPEDYFVVSESKYDFQVFRFNRFTPLSDSTFEDLIVYIGHHPSMVHKSYSIPIEKAKKSKGIFLGYLIDWLAFEVEDQQTYIKEQLIKCNAIEDDIIVHISLTSNSLETIDRLTRIVERIQLIKK